jgi:hypothetical protein
VTSSTTFFLQYHELMVKVSRLMYSEPLKDVFACCVCTNFS